MSERAMTRRPTIARVRAEGSTTHRAAQELEFDAIRVGNAPRRIADLRRVRP